jgi:hypothetical protein
MGGQTMSAIMTLGYDPQQKKYVGTWVGSPMTTMFVYEGVRDAGGSGRILPLDTTGPSWTDPTQIARYQDIIEVHGPDRRTLTSRLHLPDGSWKEFMKATYTRA